jgi:phage-related protein
MAIVDGIISLASKMLDAGKELVAGIWKGIQEAWGKLVEDVKKLGGKLVDSVKGFFKIGSPSKLFADEVGQWIPEGIAVGIDANADSVSESVDDMVKDAVVKPNVGVLNEVSSTFTPATMGMISGGNNSETTSLLNQYLPMLLQAIEESKTEISPDAHGIFNIVRNENNKYRKANGVGALA